MEAQLNIKPKEVLEQQIDQFKSNSDLTEDDHDLMNRYSDQILHISDLNNLSDDLPLELRDFVEKHKKRYLDILRETRKKDKQKENSDQLTFEEVIDDDNDPNIISITAQTDDPKEIVEQKVQQHLIEHNWWLQSYWKEKGNPKEQFTIETPYGNIDVYNFLEPLEQRHLDELFEVMQVFANIKGENPLQNIDYILFDNEQPANPNTSEDMNGQSWRKCRAIKMFPAGKSFDNHRISGASNYQGTLIHEISHNFPLSTRDLWKNTFGWSDLEEPIILPGGNRQIFKCDQPDRCISSYAKISPDEDLCESMVSAVKSPEELDIERLEFIKANILGENENTISISKRDQVELPKLSKPIKYRRKARKKFQL